MQANQDAIMQLVALLTGQTTRSADGSTGALANWQRRQTLLCLADPAQAQQVLDKLDHQTYAPTVCTEAAKAIELMRDSQVDMVLLDPQFDSANQGGSPFSGTSTRCLPSIGVGHISSWSRRRSRRWTPTWRF